MTGKYLTLYLMKGILLVSIVLMGSLMVNGCTSKAPVQQEEINSEAPASAQQEAVSFDTIQGKEWRLLGVKTASGKHDSFSREKLAADGMGDFYTLRFDTEGLVSGQAAPNRYRAPYQQEGDQGLSLSTIAGTLMASFKEPEGLIERDYYTYLTKVTRWAVVQDNLELYTTDENGLEAVLVFHS